MHHVPVAAVALTMGIAIAGWLATTPAMAQDLADFSPYVRADGAISLPDDFRSWRYLGTWSIAGDDPDGGASGFHNVFTQPGTVEAYRTTGEFPDGAVIVKELFATATEDMTTGRVSHANEVEGWFVMIKDAKGRFPDHGLWGNGWGWALFNADDPSTTVTEDYEAECLACHIPAEENDWIYTYGYPALRNEQ